MPIVTENGFVAASDLDWIEADAVAATPGSSLNVLHPNDADPKALLGHFERISLIGIPFPGFSDGRGFSLARRLRRLGYTGALRARGHVISDQYAYARSCGFDDVEIDDTLAARQPEQHWIDALSVALPPFRKKQAI